MPFHCFQIILGDTFTVMVHITKEELRICGLAEDVAAGRIELDPRRPGSLVDQWLAMGIVRWLQVRSVAPNGPRNVWSILDPSQPVAAVPKYALFDYRAGEPGRGILYPFDEPGPDEWHSPCGAYLHCIPTAQYARIYPP